MSRGTVTVFKSLAVANQYASSTSAKLLVMPQTATAESDTFKFWLIAFLKASKGSDVAFVPSGRSLPADLESMIVRLFYAHDGLLVGDDVGSFGLRLERAAEHRFVQLRPDRDLKWMLTTISWTRDELPRNLGPGIGYFKPTNVLLVGDRPSNKWGGDRPNWPFVSGLHSGCSRWLSAKLNLAGIDQSDLYWINAYNSNGTPLGEPSKWVGELAPRLIVAMGKEAGEWCTLRKLSHVSVHHPQYWKRFQATKTYHLPKLILSSTLAPVGSTASA